MGLVHWNKVLMSQKSWTDILMDTAKTFVHRAKLQLTWSKLNVPRIEMRIFLCLCR